MEGYEIRLIRSLIGVPGKHKKIIECLGLRRINSLSYHKKNKCIDGMIKKVSYLIEVKERLKGDEREN